MTTPLEDLLHRRAERAEPAPDVADTVARARTRAADLRRRRRNTAGAVSGVAIVLALISVLLVTTSGTDSSSGSRGRREAAGPLGTATASGSQHATPSPTPATSSASSASTTASASVRPHRLVAAGTTPKKAPLAVGLMPDGWHYLGSSVASTIYGPKGVDHDPNAFEGKIALLVGDRIGSLTLPLSVAGHRGRIDQDPTSTFEWNVSIDYNSKIRLNIQVPKSAGLDRAQVLRLADTLRVRDVSHPSHG